MNTQLKTACERVHRFGRYASTLPRPTDDKWTENTDPFYINHTAAMKAGEAIFPLPSYTDDLYLSIYEDGFYNHDETLEQRLAHYAFMTGEDLLQ